MPIKGLTDTNTGKLPILGFLRKGAEKKANAPGRELPYFRYEESVPGTKEVFDKLHQQPAELSIILPYATVDENFPTWREKWEAGGLEHRCDGETCVLHRLPDGSLSSEPAPCPGGCIPVGRLHFIDPAMLQAGYVGVIVMPTNSVNDITHIYRVLMDIYQRARDLRNVPLRLCRVPQQISSPSQGGKRIRRMHYMVQIFPDPQFVLSLIAPSYPSLPPAPVEPPVLPVGAGEEEKQTAVETVEETIIDGELVEEILPQEFEEIDISIRSISSSLGEKYQEPPTEEQWKRFVNKIQQMGLPVDKIMRLLKHMFDDDYRLGDLVAVVKYFGEKENVEKLSVL